MPYTVQELSSLGVFLGIESSLTVTEGINQLKILTRVTAVFGFIREGSSLNFSRLLLSLSLGRRLKFRLRRQETLNTFLVKSIRGYSMYVNEYFH